jgi:hypothetical protein
MGIEELNEVQVAQKRGLDGPGTMAFVRSELATALETFAPLQEEPLASTTAQLADLGTYPLHAIVDMFTFDITTHLRYDIVKSRGPIEVNLRSLDERQLGPAVSWLLAGIPRMQRKLPPGVCRTPGSGSDRPGRNSSHHKLRWSGDNGDAQCRLDLRASGGHHLVNR